MSMNFSHMNIKIQLVVVTASLGQETPPVDAGARPKPIRAEVFLIARLCGDTD